MTTSKNKNEISGNLLIRSAELVIDLFSVDGKRFRECNMLPINISGQETTSRSTKKADGLFGMGISSGGQLTQKMNLAKSSLNLFSRLPELTEALERFLTGRGNAAYYGACGIASEIPNRLNKLEVTPSVNMVFITLTGSRSLNFAVRMIVIIRATFFRPCSTILPKEIFRKITSPLIPCSAKLFVGEMRGYLRKTKSSFLNVINRLRMLSVSWCETEAFRRNVLNLLRIFFLPFFHSSEVSCGYRL